MRMPGFTAEHALGTSRRSYRSGAHGAAARAAGAHPAIRIQPQRRDGVECRNCDGSTFLCPLGSECVRLCTTDGQGAAYCAAPPPGGGGGGGIWV
jgi:hypothetical protein